MKPRLSPRMTLAQFDNGYWYAEDLKRFARTLGLERTAKMRKDQLEQAIKMFLQNGKLASIEPGNARKSSATPDFELGLRADLPVVNYTSNKITKAFIHGEARKIDPSFKPKSGTRYLLNRWREEQLASGKKLTYGDLALKALELNKAKTGPLRIEHGRYMNFTADFMRANPGAPRNAVIAAWHEVKKLDLPKTYGAWLEAAGVKKNARGGTDDGK